MRKSNCRSAREASGQEVGDLDGPDIPDAEGGAYHEYPEPRRLKG
jgi:hypothetical protein